MLAVKSIFGIFSLLILQCVFFSGMAEAQATRTWVSGVGDDANPCSRTAPCKTFAGAISKTAALGEIDAIDSGGFGALTITKAITIDGGVGNTAGVLVSGTNGITVQAGPSDVVTLRNLDLNGIGAGLIGVQFTSGAALHIESSTIYGFLQQGVSAETSAASQLFMKDVIIHDCAVDGVLASSSAGILQAVLDNVSLNRNASGLSAGNNTQVFIRNSQIVGSTAGTGVHAVAAPPLTSRIDITNSVIANNRFAAGVRGDYSATIYLSNVDLFNNDENMQAINGAQIISYGNNRNTGSTIPSAPTSTLPQQ